MVFFTCNGCGESVKKAQVEKHSNICRNCSCLSCIDCGKDFWGEDYKTHIKCISEDQKYGGKGFEVKAKKGDTKQQQWMQKVHEAMNESKVSPRVREILEQMDSYDNIPRKKAKFQNWMKNSLNIQNEALQEQVWEIFAAVICNDKNNQKHTQNGKGPSESVEANQDQAAAAENEEKKKNKRERKAERQKKSKKEKKHLNSKEDENSLKHEPDSKTNQLEEKKKKKLKKKHNKDGAQIVEENGNQTNRYEEQDSEHLHGNKKSKKRKCEKPSDDGPNSKQKKVEITETKEVEENDETKPGKFNWKKTIKIVLQQSPEHEVSVKKLRKKVLSQYYAESGDNNYKSEEELLATFNKKITCNPKLKVLKDKVKLVK